VGKDLVDHRFGRFRELPLDPIRLDREAVGVGSVDPNCGGVLNLTWKKELLCQHGDENGTSHLSMPITVISRHM
jgi:hypothetical protein